MSWKKEQQARMEGMKYALQIAEKDGIEGLRKEIRFRDNTGLCLKMTKAELDGATIDIKRRCIENVITIVLITISDEFGFGEKRLHRLLDRLNSRTASMNEDLIDMEEYKKQLKLERGITVDFCEWS